MNARRAEIKLFLDGADVTEEDASALTEKVQEEFPECEVDCHFGGQPVYYYMVSLE